LREDLKGAQKAPTKYKAAKGDLIDEMLGEWLNMHGCPIPIRKLGGGFYMFGTRKIFAKIINGKLVIRVGGGYMAIDEFVKHYGQQELEKMRRIGAAEEAAEYENGSDMGSPGGAKQVGKNTVIGSAAFKRSFVKSPKTNANTKTFAAGSPKMPASVTDLEATLRQLEKDAVSGKAGDGYNILNAKK
jgi:hypothetical protein